MKGPVVSTSVAQPKPAAPSGSPSAPSAGRAIYTSVAALGLVLVAAAPALMLSLALGYGMAVAEELPFFGSAIAVSLVAAGLVWRFGLWAKVVGILAAVGVAVMMFWIVFGLSYFGSIGDVLPAVLLPLGVVLAVGGGIAAIVQQRRGRRASSVTVTEKRIIVTALAVVVAVGLASLILGLVQRQDADADAELTATMADFEFVEGTYEVAAGEPTTMQVHNSDAFAHTFTVPELGIDTTVLPGDTATIEIDAPAGTYTVYCKPHADVDEPDPDKAGMAGTIVAK